jgi:hypothetical protein
MCMVRKIENLLWCSHSGRSFHFCLILATGNQVRSIPWEFEDSRRRIARGRRGLPLGSRLPFGSESRYSKNGSRRRRHTAPSKEQTLHYDTHARSRIASHYSWSGPIIDESNRALFEFDIATYKSVQTQVYERQPITIHRHGCWIQVLKLKWLVCFHW